eukprot:1353503-Alexandrium_andersonii.AAC.1
MAQWPPIPRRRWRVATFRSGRRGSRWSPAWTPHAPRGQVAKCSSRTAPMLVGGARPAWVNTPSSSSSGPGGGHATARRGAADSAWFGA